MALKGSVSFDPGLRTLPESALLQGISIPILFTLNLGEEYGRGARLLWTAEWMFNLRIF